MSEEREAIDRSLASSKGTMFLPTRLERGYRLVSSMRHRTQILIILGSVLIGNLACLKFDHDLGQTVFQAGLWLRIGLVTPLHLLAVYAVIRRLPGFVSASLLVAAQLALVGAITYLGAIAPADVGDRYIMVVGMITVMANFVLPKQLYANLLCNGGSIALMLLMTPAPLIDMVVFLSIIAVVSALGALRTEASDRRAYLLARKDQLFAEELKAVNAKLDRISQTDPLTQLFNRRGFEEHRARIVGRVQQQQDWLSVMMIDIDWFKQYNDAYGHPEGDEALSKVAEHLSAWSKKNPDIVVARYGGEEFSILLPNTDPETANLQAEALRTEIERLGIVHPHSPLGVVTVSIGVSSEQLPGEPGPPLVELADRALYQAKRSGRNRTVSWSEPAAYSCAS